MIKIIFRAAFLCLLCVLFSVTAYAQESSISVSAQSAVLISAETGNVLYEKEAYSQLSMASTTKIMTALLTLEEAARTGDPVIEITDEMVAVEGSSMGLRAGDRLCLSALAAGMLLASGNDAANAAALYIGGSQEGFAELMNARARELGLENTNFVTPSGLDDDAHYSTSYDMALLAAHALENEDFARLAGSASCQVEFSEPAKKVGYTNHNKLLTLYEDCIGVKTGFTKKSGRCLVSAAERDGVRLIAVTLNAPDDWNDHIAMLDYGFSKLREFSFDASDFSASLPLVGSNIQSISVGGTKGEGLPMLPEDAQHITQRVHLPRFLYAPVKAGDTVGKVQYLLNGKEIYSIPLTVRETALYKQKEPTFFEKIFS